MPANLRIDGLTALQAALRKLPEDLTREGAVIVHAQAEAAEGQIRTAYQAVRKTGGLVNGLSVVARTDGVSATATVRSRARHSHLFEYGTKGARHWKNGKSTGRMPEGNVFVPIVIQRRRIMLAALTDLVRRAGFDVSEK